MPFSQKKSSISCCALPYSTIFVQKCAMPSPGAETGMRCWKPWKRTTCSSPAWTVPGSGTVITPFLQISCAPGLPRSQWNLPPTCTTGQQAGTWIMTCSNLRSNTRYRPKTSILSTSCCISLNLACGDGGHTGRCKAIGAPRSPKTPPLQEEFLFSRSSDWICNG